MTRSNKSQESSSLDKGCSTVDNKNQLKSTTTSKKKETPKTEKGEINSQQTNLPTKKLTKKKITPYSKANYSKSNESILDLANDNSKEQETEENPLNRSRTLKIKKRKTINMPSTSKRTKNTATYKKSETSTKESGKSASDSPTISLKELIESKEKDKEIRVMEDISAVVEPNDTIDLEGYGNVSLENVK